MNPSSYVDRGGELVYRPPFLAEDVRFYGFILDADVETLQTKLCDRYFNDPAGEPGRFRPAVPYVMLAMCQLKELRSETPPYSDYGWYAESETAFWVLLVDTKLERLVWAFPYIWVDNAYAMAMGREVYGFPKGLGWFVIPEDKANLQALSCDTLAIPKFGPDAKGGRERLIDVTRIADKEAPSEWSSIGGLIHDLLSFLKIFGGEANLIRDAELALHSMENLMNGVLHFAFLKQFRDIAQTENACYTALTEVTCKMTKFKGGGLLDGDFSVNIHPMDTHPIAADLGLATGPITASASFWVDFDFWIGDGTEVK